MLTYVSKMTTSAPPPMQDDLRALQLKRRFLVFRNFTNIDPNKRTKPLTFTWKEITDASKQWKQKDNEIKRQRHEQQQRIQNLLDERNIKSKALVATASVSQQQDQNLHIDDTQIVADRKLADRIDRMLKKFDNRKLHSIDEETAPRTQTFQRRGKNRRRIKFTRSATEKQSTQPAQSLVETNAGSNQNRPKVRKVRSSKYAAPKFATDDSALVSRHVSIPSRFATVRVQLQEKKGFNSVRPRFDAVNVDEMTPPNNGDDRIATINVTGETFARERPKHEPSTFTVFGGTEQRFSGPNAYNLSALPVTTPPASKYFITHAVLDATKPLPNANPIVARPDRIPPVRRIRPRQDNFPAPNAYQHDDIFAARDQQTWHSDLGHLDRQAAERFPHWHMLNENPYSTGCDRFRADSLCYEPNDTAIRRQRKDFGIMPFSSGDAKRLLEYNPELKENPAPNAYFDPANTELLPPRKEYVRSAHMDIPNLEKFLMEHNPNNEPILMNLDTDRPASVGPQNHETETKLSLIDTHRPRSKLFDPPGKNHKPVAPLTHRALMQYLRRHTLRMHELGQAFSGGGGDDRRLGKSMLNSTNGAAVVADSTRMPKVLRRAPSPGRYQNNTLRGPKKRSFHFNWDRIWMNR